MTRRSMMGWLGLLLAPVALAGAVAVPGGRAGAAQDVERSRPALQWSESLNEKVVCTGPAGARDCQVRQVSRLHIEAIMPLAGKDAIRQFNADTGFAISVGNYAFSASLGDDPKYRPGKKNARFVVIEPGGGGQQVIRLEWDAKALHASVEGVTRTGSESIMADAFTEDAAGPFNGTTTASMALADASSDYDVRFKGAVDRHTVRQHQELFNLTGVTVVGLGFRL